MKFTTTDRKHLRLALRLAIKVQEDKLDTHPDFRVDRKRWKRDIDVFQHLHVKLDTKGE